MPRKQLTHEQKLEKYKILTERYDTESQALQELGYEQPDIDRVIVRKYSKNTVKKLLELHQELINKGITHKQLIKIAGHDGGSKNLAAMKESFDVLQALKFNAEQIVQIVGHNGGSKNLAAVKESVDVLQAFNFTAEQIVKIAGHDGGSRNLAAVKESFEVLQELDFNAVQIVKIVGHDGGSKNLAAVIAHCAELKQFGLTNESIVKSVSYDGGSKQLLRVVEENRKQDAAMMLTRMTTDFLDVMQAPRQDKGSLAFICNGGDLSAALGMHGVFGVRQAGKRTVSDAELDMTTAPAVKKVKQ